MPEVKKGTGWLKWENHQCSQKGIRWNLKRAYQWMWHQFLANSGPKYLEMDCEWFGKEDEIIENNEFHMIKSG